MPDLLIRDVSPEIVVRLKARAAREGVSVPVLVRQWIEKALARPTRAEVLDALAALPPVEPRVPAADVLRQVRRSRAGDD